MEESEQNLLFCNSVPFKRSCFFKSFIKSQFIQMANTKNCVTSPFQGLGTSDSPRANVLEIFVYVYVCVHLSTGSGLFGKCNICLLRFQLCIRTRVKCQ